MESLILALILLAALGSAIAVTAAVRVWPARVLWLAVGVSIVAALAGTVLAADNLTFEPPPAPAAVTEEA